MSDPEAGAGRTGARAETTKVHHGVVAGVLGGAVVAVFFFFIDLAAGELFRTPAFVASMVFGGEPGEIGAVLIGAFTVLHFLVFAGIGAVAVVIFDWAEIPQNLLLGAIYGLFAATLLFYGSLIVAGGEARLAPAWPALLLGNLLAGLAMGGYLHWIGPHPGVTGIRNQLELHPTVREGLVAGMIGALAVAVWFLVVDMLAREFLFTPAALGSAIFLGAGGAEEVRITMATVFGYTAIHFAGFLTFGMGASALVTEAERFPPLVFALLIMFVAFEVLFIALAALLGGWILAELAWWSVLTGNLLAALTMGGYLWRVHPELRRELRAGAIWVE